MRANRFCLAPVAALAIAGCQDPEAQKRMEDLDRRVKALEGHVAAETAHHEEPPAPTVELPEWVQKGSVKEQGDEGTLLYGVGVVSGIKNVALARSTADNRARAEVAKLVETHVEATEGGGGKEIKTHAAATLSGVEIVDHWIHPTEGSVYALARLEVRAEAPKDAGTP